MIKTFDEKIFLEKSLLSEKESSDLGRFKKPLINIRNI